MKNSNMILLLTECGYGEGIKFNNYDNINNFPDIKVNSKEVNKFVMLAHISRGPWDLDTTKSIEKRYIMKHKPKYCDAAHLTLEFASDISSDIIECVKDTTSGGGGNYLKYHKRKKSMKKSKRSNTKKQSKKRKIMRF